MRTSKNSILMAITLIGVMAFAGTAQAIQPVGGQVNSDVVEGLVVTLYLDGNPDDYVTAVVLDFDPIDVYQFNDIQPLLARGGIAWLGTYNATIEMRCSGVSRDNTGNLHDSYTNTFGNTTPTTAHVTGTFDGNTYFASIMELESCASEEITFSKPLYEGWNLISLPLTPLDNSASAVLTDVSYNSVYRYNATSKQFESAATMDPGIGYFVHVTSDCMWEYSGTPHTSISTELKQGLNMVGWLDCSKDVSDSVSSISGKYYYVAQWNATAEKFEVYNPAAPSVFNDFTTIDQGTGYFISARQDCTLSESC
jgi:hypothetical protein